MLNRVIEDLNGIPNVRAGFREPPSSGVDAYLEVVVDGRSHLLAIEARKRAPYPGELATLFDVRDRIGTWGTPTLVAPVIPESIGNQLIPLGWSWADEQGHYDLPLSRSVRLSRRPSSRPPAPAPSRGSIPRGQGGLAIIRLLLSAPRDVFFRTSDLASVAGVTDARASQVAHKLQERQLIERSGDGWRPVREDLLDAFVAAYRGPGGTELPFYVLDDLRDAAAELVDRVERSTPRATRVAISADVGPDLLVPWRRPTKLVVYVDSSTNVDLADLTQASDRQSANLLVRFPDDRSVFPHPRLTGTTGTTELPLADVSQMIWDLYDLGGEDRAEAARHLSEWLTKSR